ncbi:hypothetical protein D9756_000744 [Leucocoprinus leucothites]|uniref:Uncharacterized protein n=1 Tax=Leucocoprinus leucothites TaxID=201217 RepID=A0A8H5GF96_9AGAR|nr:hypothetical protein D9756_000744 [Leucoagaricus leucothites]
MPLHSSQNNPSTIMAPPTNIIPTLTMEEEDNIVLARITNDERPLKRVIKKFHSYVNAAANPTPASKPADDPVQQMESIDDAKEAFLVELASLQLLLKKSVMTCEAETRQVENYQMERYKIEQEHESLEIQIKELKVALEHAQILRRRKMEYDVVAEKIHTLPSREELEQEIASLENDMAAIHSENETQEKMIQGHKSALDSIVAELASLRFLGRDKDTMSEAPSGRATPVLEVAAGLLTDAHTDASTRANSDMPTPSAREDAEEEKTSDEPESQKITDSNPDDDIEMGELEEDPKEKEAAVKKKPLAEELEEGETFDGSSELSEPPDDSEEEL